MAGIFVTGTDTGVGKTVVSACLVRHFAARYWKPVQTGLAVEEGDTPTVARLAALPAAVVHPPLFSFAAPLSPEEAGRREGVRLSLADFALPAGEGPIVVEGAGGVLVPLGGGALMVDLMVRLALPVLLVARSTLGTINHTLLSLEALRLRRLSLLGVVLVGPPSDDNAAAIARFGDIPIIASIPQLETVDPAAIKHLCQSIEKNQKFFGSFFQKRTAFL